MVNKFVNGLQGGLGVVTGGILNGISDDNTASLKTKANNLLIDLRKLSESTRNESSKKEAKVKYQVLRSEYDRARSAKDLESIVRKVSDLLKKLK